MSDWHRALAAALFITGAAAGTARAQSPQKRASALNDEGKTLMFATPPNYEAAAVKFRQAIVLSPEGRFYFNLCVSEYQVGDFGNALMACQAVDANSTASDDKVKKNASDLIVKIKEQMKQQGMNPDAVATTTNPNPDGTNPNGTNPNGTNPNGTNPDGTNPNGTNPDGTNPDGTNPNGTNPNGTNPNGTNPNGTNPNVVNPNPNAAQFRGAPPPSLFATAPPEHSYTYTFGAALIAGSGSIGDSGAYGSGVGGIRLLGDLLFSPATKLGGEGYIDILNVQDAGGASQTGGMTLVDFGVGVYKHFCGGRLCFTPMLGAHIVGYSPANNPSGSQDFASLGVRVQGSVGYAFGSRYEHYISVNLGVDGDAKPLGTYDTPLTDPAVQLNSGAVIAMLSIGYQYRFNTPFGQTPFFQLE